MFDVVSVMDEHVHLYIRFQNLLSHSTARRAFVIIDVAYDEGRMVRFRHEDDLEPMLTTGMILV